MDTRDTYDLVNERIIAALEAGTIPWQRPWHTEGGLPRNLVSQQPYRGINLLLLSLAESYSSPWWVTYKQAVALKGQVRRGEKASLVTFWKFWDQPGEGGAQPTLDGRRRPPLLKRYWVFNSQQCDGLPVPDPEGFAPQEWDTLPLCEHIVETMPQRPPIHTGRRQAYYVPARDYVGIPDLRAFTSPEAYYATLFHELTHATGHPTRLDRSADLRVHRFGSPDYSKEELVAELGAGYLCAVAGIWPAVTDNSAAYIASWLRRLQDDRTLLVRAAGQAQKAADFILGRASESDVA